MARWLMKSEPVKYAFSDLVRDGKTVWDGVRNFTARGHLKAMLVRLPHITSLMTESLDDLIAESEVLVIGKRFDGFDVALQRARVDHQIVVDLARVWPGTVSQVAERPVVRIN